MNQINKQKTAPVGRKCKVLLVPSDRTVVG